MKIRLIALLTAVTAVLALACSGAGAAPTPTPSSSSTPTTPSWAVSLDGKIVTGTNAPYGLYMLPQIPTHITGHGCYPIYARLANGTWAYGSWFVCYDNPTFTFPASAHGQTIHVRYYYGWSRGRISYSGYDAYTVVLP